MPLPTSSMKNLHEKLVAIQSELKAPKNQKNAFAGYKYRSCEDILEALKPLLKEHQCVLTLSDEVMHFSSNTPQQFIWSKPSKDGKSAIEESEIVGGDRFYIKATASISDGENLLSASAWAREPESKKGSDESQITGAASSYARKYALNGLFCIDDAADADATNDHVREIPKKAVAAAKPVPKPQVLYAVQSDIDKIDELCRSTTTDKKLLYEHFKVVDDKPTKVQALSMIESLKAKFEKMVQAEFTSVPQAA